jgi:hypothetical protein
VPRPIAEPQRALERWEAARKATKPSDELNGNEMAKALGWTWRNLKIAIEEDDGFPVKERGAEGRSFVFVARWIMCVSTVRAKAQIAEAAARSERLSRLAGVEVEGERERGLSVADLVKIDGLQTTIQRRKIEQGLYTRTDETAALLSDMFTVLQTEWLGAAARADPAGQWPANMRAQWDDEARNVLVAVHDRLGSWLKERRGGITR